MLTHLSLFSGIGGLDLAAEWAGFTTIGQCEWADYPTKVLEKHWPSVPRWRDIRTLTKESFYERTGLHTVDIISGGFPCQPFSVAGKRRGKDDDRYLWPEMLRVISELRPAWVIGENVANFVKMALDTAITDLENEDYEVQSFIIPACAVGAWHKRDRVFIVAYTGCKYGKGNEQDRNFIHADKNREANESKQSSKGIYDRFIANPYGKGLEGIHDASNGKHLQYFKRRGEQWEAEPCVDRVANGIPNRVDRLKCLGNAVVPQQAYPIFKAIAEIELGS